nr:MAG TPA: protein of unknown function (DUF1882) [Caudoviricetes sp.]
MKKSLFFSTFRKITWILNPTFQSKQKNRQQTLAVSVIKF